MGATGPEDELERELARLRDALDAERRVSEQWRRVAEERRVAMERLRQRRVVRIVLAAAKVLLPPARRLHARLRAMERRIRRIGAGVVGARHRLTAGRREAALHKAVDELPSAPRDHRRVHVVILTRDGREHLERLLPRLRSVEHDALEVTVVDNASGPDTRDWLERQPEVRVMWNTSNLSYSDANNRGAAAPEADVLLFLNDDVEPIGDDWLGRMLKALHDDIVAVGAQLVYPRRTLLDGRTRDVSVQHAGIALQPDGDGPPRAVNRGHGRDADPTQPTVEVAGATGACLLVDRAAFDAVGGFDQRYEYGAEDVDLCWRLRQAGGRVVVAPDAVLWHREGATRHRGDDHERELRQERNWDRLADRFGPEMRGAVEQDRVHAKHVLSDRPWRAGITITRDLESAGYGDWYTAHELGEELTKLGWGVRYLERYRDAWYETADDLDVVIALHDEFDVRRVARPGMTTVAWVRNWADRWVGHPWFDDIDVVAASSGVIADEIVASSRRSDVPVLPLATNPARFSPGTSERHGAVLTVNNWGVERGVGDLVRAVDDVDLYGKGWEGVAGVGDAWRGHLPYEDLPDVYARAAVVIDQAAPHTRPFASLNSRVFDALASGSLVVTDQVEGARELFGDLLPTYDGPAEAARVVREAMQDSTGSRALAARLREEVLENHTYRHRAEQLRDLVADHLARPTVVVRIGAPNRREARNWGDTFYAEALTAEFHAAGHRAAVQTLDEWEDRRGRGFDVSLHLKGRSRCPRSEGQIHAVWVISHPDEVDPNELEVADVVFAASSMLAAHVRDLCPGLDVHTLLQATYERRFRPRSPDPRRAHDVVFVGNSRFSERPMVLAAERANIGLAVYGANWERYLPPGMVVDRFVPNEDVPVLYSSAAVVLNDHWEDMRRWGLVSNRVFDALACGACVLSDDVAGLSDLFGDAVAVATPDTLAGVAADLLADPERREMMGRQGREAVLASHTFRHRVDTLLAVVAPLVAPPAGR